jgi:hypothetical protein
VLAVVVVAGMSGGGGDADAAPTSSSVASMPVASPTTVPVITQPDVVVQSTDQPLDKTTFAAPVTVGSQGGDVQQLQERLIELGFNPGPADGVFGEATSQAVWAYKKLVMKIGREELRLSDNASMVTPEMWLSMQDPIVIQPRRPNAWTDTHVEIYLPEQVLAVYTDDRPTLIAHISSGELNPDGSPATFCETAVLDTDANGNPLPEPEEKAICAESKTPGGVFTITRRYEGKRVGPLGGMLNPLYFNYGIAMHGANNVPLAPASHGCVRVSNRLGEILPTLVDNGDVVYVWGHNGKEPEGNTKAESLPSFNRPDPSVTTTTSTTVATTTTKPAATTTTTKPATPTTKPAPTTTKPAPTTTVPPTTVAPTLPPTTTPPPTTAPSP